jgi:trigger factor
VKVTTEPVADRQVALTIEVPSDRIERAMQRAAREVSRRLQIRGFRPGKAPYPIVLRQVGQERLLESAVSQIGPDIFNEAIQQANLEPISYTNLEIIQQEPLTLKTVVSLQPVVELADYHSIRVTPEPVQVTDEQIDEVIERLREEQAQLVPVERPAQRGDQVTADVRGVYADETILDWTSDELILGQDLESMVGSEFIDQVVGLAAGDERTFVIAYAEDFANSELAGREVTFTVAVQDVKERRVPEPDDQLARTVSDFETLADLRADIARRLRERQERQAGEKLADDALQSLVEQSRIEFPPDYVARETETLLKDYGDRLRQQGFELDRFLAISGRNLEDLRSELQLDARERVRRALALRRFIEQEGIAVSDEDIEREIDQLVSAFGQQSEAARNALDGEETRADISNRLLVRRARQRLSEIATRSNGETAAAPETAPAAPPALPEQAMAAVPGQSAAATAETPTEE